MIVSSFSPYRRTFYCFLYPTEIIPHKNKINDTLSNIWKNVHIAVKQCPLSSSHGSSWYSCWKKSSVNYCGCVLSLLMKPHCSCFTHISDYCFGFFKSVTREVSDLQWKMDMGNIPQGLDYCRMLWREENFRLKHWKVYMFGL